MHFEISHDEHRERYRRLQAAMHDAGIDTLLSWSPENVYYMTGYDTLGYYFPQCFIASVDSPPSLVVRHFESPNVERQTWLDRYVGYRDHESVADVVAAEVGRFGGRVATEAQTWAVSPAVATRIAELVDGIVAVDGLVEQLRLVKSPAEIALIRQSCRYTEAAMTAAFEAAVPGANEDEVAAAIYSRMIAAGSTYPSLAPFVSSGPRTFHRTRPGAAGCSNTATCSGSRPAGAPGATARADPRRRRRRAACRHRSDDHPRSKSSTSPSRR